MTHPTRQTVVLEVTFSKRQAAQPILDRLLESGLRAATVLRGRVTASDAWYELELEGSIPAVEAAVRRNRGEGISFKRFSSTLA